MLFCWQSVIVSDVSVSTISLKFISASIRTRNGRLTLGSGCRTSPPTSLFSFPSACIGVDGQLWSPVYTSVGREASLYA